MREGTLVRGVRRTLMGYLREAFAPRRWLKFAFVSCRCDGARSLTRSAEAIAASQRGDVGEGHGRNEDCSSPPVQIRACGIPAPGSCLRSNVIGLRGMGYPCSSDPWARCFSDMRSPALCPEHASQRALPSTDRLPSTVSAADVTRHCSRLLRYYAAVRLLIRVHAHRSALAFMGRSGVLTGHG